jgi:hypothetical protein
VKRVFRYLNSKDDFGLTFSGGTSKEIKLHGSSDANWAENPDNRRSVTGITVSINGNFLVGRSKLQATVAHSTCEAEYMALDDCVREVVYQRRLLAELGFEQKEPTVVEVDNRGAIDLAHNPVHHGRTKHIEIRYHYVREQILAGTIFLKWVASEENLSDIFTKPLTRERFTKLRDILTGRHNIWSAL